MSQTQLLEDIKTDLDRVDAESLLSIREIIDLSLRKISDLTFGSEPTRMERATASRQSLKFVGKNLLPEEYQRLSLEERGVLQWRLKQQNRTWLQKQFSKLGAAWVVVIDGKVFASGKTLENKPMSPQILKICQRTGKFPFMFVNDKFITIEEGSSAWKTTIRAGDYYPTLPIKLGSAAEVLEINGDFDSGSSHTFVDYEFLASQSLVRPELRDYPETHIHLNVLLDFEQHQTEILPSVAAGQSRKSKAGRKKRASRRRR